MIHLSSRTERERGVALIMVIVVVVMLVLIAIPFAMSMRRSLKGSTAYLNQVEARFAARAGIAEATASLYRLHPGYEASPLGLENGGTPDFDGKTEFENTVPLGLARGKRVRWATRVADEQGKVNLNTASPYLLGNLIGSGMVSHTVDAGETEIPLLDGSVSGFFNPNGGYLWYAGELISYGSFDGSTFSDCERGLFGEELPEFRKAGKLLEGTLVIDARAYLLAKLPYEVAGPQDIDGALEQPYLFLRTIDEARGLAEPKVDEASRPGLMTAAFSAAEFDRLRPLVTVSSSRHSGEGWIRSQVIRNSLDPGEEDEPKPTQVRVLRAEWYPIGSTVRIQGAGGTEHAMVVFANSDRNGNGLLVLNRRLQGSYTAGEATISVDEPHPININTASYEVLKAIFKGVGRTPRWAMPGFPLTGKVVSPEQCEAIVGAVIDWRAENPFRNALDLRACLKGMPEELGDGLINSILAGVEFGGGGTFFYTGTIGYKSGPAYTIESTGFVEGAGGRELARHTIRQIIHVVPPVAISGVPAWGTYARGQAMLDRESRRWQSAQVLSRPRYNVGRDPRLTGLGDLIKVATGEASADEAEQGNIGPRPEIIDFRGGDKLQEPKRGQRPAVEHYNGSDDGTALAQRQLPIFGKKTKLSNNTGCVQTGSIAFWYRHEGGEGEFCSFGTPGSGVNEISFSLIRGELVLRVASTSLEGGWGEVRHRWAPNSGTWYHLACSWKSDNIGHQAITIDGLPVGSSRLMIKNRPASTHLSAEVGAGDDAIPVESTAGFPSEGVIRVGNELIEYESIDNGAFKVRRTFRGFAGSATYFGRAARGTTAATHPEGAQVTPWGFSNAPTVDYYQGGGETLHEVRDDCYTNVAIVKKALKFIERADTTIEVADTSNFPDSGYAVIGSQIGVHPQTNQPIYRREIIFYDGKTATELSNVKRGQLGTQAPRRHPNTRSYVVSISLEVDNHRGYKDLPPILVAIDNEWFQPSSKETNGGKRYFVFRGALNRLLDDAANGNPVRWSGRGVMGTSRAGHAANTRVLPVFEVRRINHGTMSAYPLGHLDKVTFIDRNNNSSRELRTVRWSWHSVVTLPDGTVRERYFISFDSELKKGYRRRDRLTRLLKFPTGELPNERKHSFTLGSADGTIGGRIDELFIEVFGDPGPFFVSQPATADADAIVMSGASSLPQNGGVVRIGGEVIGFARVTRSDPKSNIGTLEGCRRGLWGSTARNLDVGSPVMNQAYLRAAPLAGALGADDSTVNLTRVQNWPLIGMARVGDELIGYLQAGGTALRGPTRVDGRGAFRGRFGTAASSHSEGEMAIWIPHRVLDRYSLRCDTPEIAYHGTTWGQRGAVLAAIGWWREADPNPFHKVHALVRMRGAKRWDAEPVKVDENADDIPGGELLLLRDNAPRSLGLMPADWVQVRFLFHWRPGSYPGEAWKIAPSLRGWQLQYLGESMVLHREVGR